MTGAPGEGTIERMVDLVRSGAVVPDHFFREALDRIIASEGGEAPLNAFLSRPTGAPQEPSEVEALPRGGAPQDDQGSPDPATRLLLRGVPIAVKDNIATLDFPTTCASRMLEGYRSPFEATVVRKLREAGALIVGKTNMDEFGMGSSNENSAFGPVRNPHDAGRVPGGSSGGSAAAVAAGIVPAALGSDTGGSVRQPAAFCGVVGIKPTYGRVSRYGLVSFASSLDQIGTFGRTVRDAALLLQVIAGHDSRDSTSCAHPVGGPFHVGAFGSPPEGVNRVGELAGLTIGVPVEYFPESLDPAIRRLCDRALEGLRARGASVRSVSLPHTEFAIPTYYIIAPAEASSNLARYDGVRFGRRAAEVGATGELYERSRSDGFGAEVKRRIMLGTYVLSSGYYDAYYARAQKVRGLIAHDFEQAFGGGGGSDRVDLLFTPVTPSTAFFLGERLEDPLHMYLSDLYTVTANLAGLPALSLPIGRVEGLPAGGQLIAPKWAEGMMIRAASALESALDEDGFSEATESEYRPAGSNPPHRRSAPASGNGEFS